MEKQIGRQTFTELFAHVRWFGDQIFDQFITYDCRRAAASLTFTTLFSIVPVMAVGYLILTLVPGSEKLADTVSDFVFRHFVPESSSELQAQLAEFSNRAIDLQGPSLIILIITSFALLVTIESAFNGIWQVTVPRKGLSRFLTYWGVLTVGPPLVIASLIATGYVWTLPFVAEIDQEFALQELIASWLPEIATTASFTVIFYAIPNTYVPFKHALIGGVVTTLAFSLAKWGFSEAVVRMDTAVIYGTFAAVPFFLMWLYLTWVLVLVGAIFVRTLSLSPEVEEATPEPMIIKCARVLKLLHDAHLEGTKLTDAEIGMQVRLTRDEHDKLISVLREEGLLQTTEDEKWVLGRNLKTVTLWSIHSRLPEVLRVESFDDIDDLRAVVERFRGFAAYGSEHLDVSFDEVFDEVAA